MTRRPADPPRFVCAFRGRRDSYQVPLALAEAGWLDQFITDAYAGPWLKALAVLAPARARASILGREQPGIPPDRVRCLWPTTVLEHARHRIGLARAGTYARLDPSFSRAAAGRAARSGADLLLYSPYAWEAFRAAYRHSPVRCLFQYHPHPDLERRILERSAAPSPQESTPPAERDRDVWKHADVIVCASTFTRRSLVEAGAPPEKCHVVPYGIDLPREHDGFDASRPFGAVFVGSGDRRKGLHHLLAAWKRARLPTGSTLTLVCRAIDGDLLELARSTPGVEHRPWVHPSELERLYAASALFVMPSLVEGFGQVYLEALACGTPVLGTPNTCLPDLGNEADGVFMVEPDNEEALVARLEEIAQSLPARAGLRAAARACAARFPWTSFRAGLRGALGAARAVE